MRKGNGEKGRVPSALISEPSNDSDEIVTPRTPTPNEEASREAMMSTLMTTSVNDGPWKTSTVSVVKGKGDLFLTISENEPVTVLDFFAPNWCRVEVKGKTGLVPKDLLNPTFIGVNGIPSTSFKNRRPVLFIAQAKFDYTGKGKTELSFKAGDVVGVKKEVPGGWYAATFDRRTGHVPASFFNRIVFDSDGVTPLSTTSASPASRSSKPANPTRVTTPPATSPRTLPRQQSTPDLAPEKKKLVLRRKSTVSKELVEKAQAMHKSPPPPQDDLNALPQYNEIEPLTVTTLKNMLDESEKKHAEEMAAMKALATAQIEEVDKLKQQIADLESRLSSLQTMVEETLSQVEVVEEE